MLNTSNRSSGGSAFQGAPLAGSHQPKAIIVEAVSTAMSYNEGYVARLYSNHVISTIGVTRREETRSCHFLLQSPSPISVPMHWDTPSLGPRSYQVPFLEGVIF